uniref:actin cytoskeleton-regulatory complex protein pan1-like n=1 Tax=Oncorhynchus gorbuscha TaxID=8017 RepID=UPI001EAE9807|nr:actin cytoskeleton-regulatory complex protein pan1-like [Oncorhynchus gorbuscha]
MDDMREAADDYDCPSLLCDEQEDEEEESYRGDDETRGEEGGDIEEWDTGERGGERVEEEEENGGEMEKNGEMGEDGVTEREKESEVVVDFEEDGGEMEKRQLRKRIGRAEKEKEEEAVLIEDRRGSEEEMKDRRERDGKVEEEKKQKGVMGPALSLDLVGVTTDPVGMTTTTHEDSGYLSSGMGFYCPPGPLLFHTQPKPHPQPLLPSGVKRPHSVSPPPTQSLQVKVTRVYSTRRSIGYSARGRGQVLPLPLLPAVTMGDPSLLPSLPKKKTRTLYSTDQLEQLEGMFQEDHYPDGEKRKEIAATVGVTPQRIMVWFQNRRAKWRKASRSAVKPEHKQTCSRLPDPNPTSLLAPHPRAAAGHIAPFLPPAGLSLPPPPTTQALPSYSTLLASLSSSPTGRSVGERGPPSGPQGGSVEHLPPIMYSPPPLRRASLPLLTTFLNPPNPTPSPSPTPPTLQPTPTSPFFMDVLEPHPPNRDTQGLTLQTDSGSLFDYSSDLLSSSSSSVKIDPQHYLTSSHQGGATVSYQPQASRLAYLTPSPYLNPNPPEGSAPPPSYLTFGPGGGPGVVTYAAGGHTYFQAQTGGGQILLQSGIHGGITAYQSYPWDQLYSHPAVIQQRNQCSQFTTTSLGGRDHPTSSSYLPPTYYPRSHTHSQRPSHTLTHTSTQAQVLPPVSILQHPHPRGVSAPQPRVPTPPLALLDPPTCVKAENESPPHIHSSHFHCDFSPILF